jgi:hypothetical protein
MDKTSVGDTRIRAVMRKSIVGLLVKLVSKINDLKSPFQGTNGNIQNRTFLNW